MKNLSFTVVRCRLDGEIWGLFLKRARHKFKRVLGRERVSLQVRGKGFLSLWQGCGLPADLQTPETRDTLNIHNNPYTSQTSHYIMRTDKVKDIQFMFLFLYRCLQYIQKRSNMLPIAFDINNVISVLQ